jgi:Malate:quinone oxidoreductase (Mqo)
MTEPQSATPPDVLLVGAGVMSATLAALLKGLDPGLKIEMYEVLGSEAQESSKSSGQIQEDIRHGFEGAYGVRNHPVATGTDINSPAIST